MSRSTEFPTCDRVLDLLEPFVDGEVSAEEQALVQAHVERCPTCARELSIARRIQTELRALPQPELPPHLAKDLLGIDPAQARPRELGSTHRGRSGAGSLRKFPRPGSGRDFEAPARGDRAPSARRSSSAASQPWRWAAVGGLAAVLVAALLVLWTAPFDSSPQVVDQPTPSAAEIAQAEAEARYALAQVAAVSRRAGLELRDDVLAPHLVQPMTRNLTDSLRTVPDVPHSDRSTGDDA